ncbi:MAG: Tetratricopeptide 1 repeat-containing protein, partial [Acidobacteria bacterium]|nr:Tetratricopeptide 1 repeat-containing protein [Acidobacteriota bacterium]
AARLAPNYWMLDLNRGIVEGALGDQAAAERHFRRALALRPDANAHFFYARWLVERGRGAEALPHLRDARRLSPAFGDARSLLLTLDDALDAPERAALLAETRGIDPVDPLLPAIERSWPTYEDALRAGLAAMQRRDWAAAVHASRDAIRHDAASADAWNNLGWSLEQLGFHTEAADAYRKALAIDPHHERAGKPAGPAGCVGWPKPSPKVASSPPRGR